MYNLQVYALDPSLSTRCHVTTGVDLRARCWDRPGPCSTPMWPKAYKKQPYGDRIDVLMNNAGVMAARALACMQNVVPVPATLSFGVGVSCLCSLPCCRGSDRDPRSYDRCCSTVPLDPVVGTQAIPERQTTKDYH